MGVDGTSAFTAGVVNVYQYGAVATNQYSVSNSTNVYSTQKIFLSGFYSAAFPDGAPARLDGNNEVISAYFTSFNTGTWWFVMDVNYKDSGNNSFSYSANYYYG